MRKPTVDRPGYAVYARYSQRQKWTLLSVTSDDQEACDTSADWVAGEYAEFDDAEAMVVPIGDHPDPIVPVILPASTKKEVVGLTCPEIKSRRRANGNRGAK